MFGNGNEVSKLTSKRWQISAKTKPDFQAEKTLLLKFQYANRMVITSTNNFVPEKTSIPSSEHRNLLPCARYRNLGPIWSFGVWKWNYKTLRRLRKWN